MRIYELKDGSYAFNLEECEEKLLIAAYEEVRNNIPPDQTWPAEFENDYFHIGYGVREYFIGTINAVRKRLSLEEIALKETAADGYCRISDKLYKARRRRDWWEEYRRLAAEQQKDWFIRSRDETLVLPAPRTVYAEWKAKRESLDGNLFSARETAMRSKALGTTAPAGDTTQRICRQLTLSKSAPNADTLIPAIIAKVDPDIALDVAEQIEDPALISALVQRSLEG